MSMFQGLGKVRKGWKLLRTLTVRVASPQYYTGKLPSFVPSVVDERGQVITKARWRGGEKVSRSLTSHPVFGQGVV